MADLAAGDDALRARLEQLLLSGLETEWAERAYTSEAVTAIVARLGAVAPDDYPAKLAIAGFTSHPHAPEDDEIVQACESCMYFVVHRQFCELPELQLPVKPQWSCRLWRI